MHYDSLDDDKCLQDKHAHTDTTMEPNKQVIINQQLQ